MRIVIDEYNLGIYTDVFFVNDDLSFIEARNKILNLKMDANNEKSIVVNVHPYSAWFHDVENENQIIVEYIRPSKKLREKYNNVDFDGDLEEKDIVELDLLNNTIEPTEVAIINKFIGSFLLAKTSLKNYLYEITNFASNPPKQFTSSIYLKKKWLKYLNKIEIDSATFESLILCIKDGDPSFCKLLNQLIYVSNSKYLLTEWIHDNKDELEAKIGKVTEYWQSFLLGSKCNFPIKDEYEAQIESYFKTLYKEDLANFFNEKSNYKGSLKAFVSIAKSISNDQKEFIFSHYIGLIDDELNDKINALIKPLLSPPPIIDDLTLSEQIQAWHNWAVESFIPFKFYLDEFPNENEVKLVEEYSITYSDWLNNTYGNIIQSGIKTNYNIAGLINNELNNSSVIWLIIDGFPSVFVKVLNEILRSNGINNINNDYHFAAVPSITQIGIPTQLSGLFPQSYNFTNVREDSLKLGFKSKKTIFKNKVKDFDEALNSEFDLCCLHWLEIDEFMHKEDYNIDGRRIDEVKRLLNNRISKIANFLKLNSNRKLKLIISTDHGSTKCLEKGQTIKNSSLTEASKDNPKERCLALIGPLSKVNIDENEVYYLKSDITLNVNDWVVAKGYRYFGKFDYGYRHGGLTPEETIVPFISCEILQHEILPIKIRFVGIEELKLGFTETIELLVTNENDGKVEIHNISILEDRNFKIAENNFIMQKSAERISSKIKLAKDILVKDGKAQLNISINYSVFGEKNITNSIITVAIKKSGNENLDNLFN